jgi:hypothetical protein
MNTIIKMKKHPIDDLFAKKLVEHRQEPSQKAFEKFQARLSEKQQKPKGGFFLINRNWAYYAAAAGVVIALSVGFLSQTNTPNNSSLASNHVLKLRREAGVDSRKNIDNQALASNENKNQTLEKSIKQNFKINKNASGVSPVYIPENNIAKVEIQANKVDNKIMDDSPEVLTNVAVNQIFTNPIIENTNITEEKNQGLFKTDIGESLVLVLEPKKREPEIIVAIDSDSEITLAEAKRLGSEKEENAKSFVAKLYGEYKHFKYGEKVDLKKLGVKDVLASVDNSVLKEDITDVRDFVQRKVGRLQKRD